MLTNDQFQAKLAAYRKQRADRVGEAAVALAETEGLTAVTRSRVAAYAQVSQGTVSNAYGGLPALRDAVMREAIRRPVLSVLAQGLAMGDPIARAAPENVRAAALATLAT